jgi:enhancing lycopene biosynthesis protein 2
MKKFAVILCGAGNLDGSEIHEATLALLAIDELNCQYQCFASDTAQGRVMNFVTGQPEVNESRNQLKEAARIARGKIKPLTDLKVQDFDALILPGGFGVAFSLCNFAEKGHQAQIQPEISEIIQVFHAAKKTIGAICISPALIALALKDKTQNLTLTLGNEEDASGKEIEKLNCKVIPCKPDEYIIDQENLIVSTPAYMNATRISEVKNGIEKLVKAVLELL